MSNIALHFGTSKLRYRRRSTAEIIITILIKHNADISKHGEIAIYLEVIQQNTKIIELFKASTILLVSFNNNSKILLELVFENKNSEIYSKFINFQDYNGNSILSSAVLNNDQNALLEYRANINIKSLNGKSTTQLADEISFTVKYELDYVGHQNLLEKSLTATKFTHVKDESRKKRVPKIIPSKINNTNDDLVESVTSKVLETNEYHKHRHHHEGHRDIGHAWERAEQDNNNENLLDVRGDILAVSSAAGSSLTTWADNIVNWIKGNTLWTFKILKPIRQVKNLLNAYNDKTQSTIYDLDISDHLGCGESQKQGGLVNKFSMVQKIDDQIYELLKKKVAATALLQELYQRLKTVEEELFKYDQYEYEEDLSRRLLEGLTKRKITIQQHIKANQIATTEKINTEIEKMKHSIQDNTQLNCGYFREIEILKKEMLEKEELGDAIINIYYEDRTEYIKEQIKACEEENIILNNALQELEAQQTKDYTLVYLVEERIFEVVEPFNIEEAKILQEEDELAIMHKNRQKQQQEVYRIKDQIKLQESLIESMRDELNTSNQEFEILDGEDNNLSLHAKLSYCNGVLEKNVHGTTYQLPSWINSNDNINLVSLSNAFIENDIV